MNDHDLPSALVDTTFEVAWESARAGSLGVGTIIADELGSCIDEVVSYLDRQPGAGSTDTGCTPPLA